jgi:hypothetical protein
MFPRLLTLFVLTTLALPQSAGATETRRWIVDTAEQFLEGRGEGVAVTSNGMLERFGSWSAGPTFEEPVVLAGAREPGGSLIVGTGHPARLYRVVGDSAEVLAEVPAEEITALLVGEDGEILVATVAPGILYRWKDGALNEVGRLGEGGIWDLALFGGTVVAAGGPPAAIYRLGSRGLERWVELPDVHARCLATKGDVLLVGTSGKGLILSIDPSGKLGVLADSPFTEITDLAVGGGAVWAAALVGEPVVQQKKSTQETDQPHNGESESTTAEVNVSVDLQLPKVNGNTATSEVIKLTTEGGLLSLHRFTEQVASAVAWDGEGLLVGTGYEGELWRFVDGGGARVASVDAVQIVGLIDGGEAILTQGPGGVLWRRNPPDRAPTYRSPIKDFEQPVRFGEYKVEPRSTGARIRFRSGISAKPDPTWLPWSEWMPAAGGRVGLPPASSLQWEIELPSDGAGSGLVDRVEVAYVEVNLPPRVKSLDVEEPGVVYLMTPPPTGPVIEAVHPDVNGIFTVVDESAPKVAASAKGKKFYRAGYRTVTWEATDPNDDPLRFLLEVEDRGGHQLEVRDRVTGTQLAVDTTALPDGAYRFRLTASDAPGNPEGALDTTVLSRWFTIDNTPPVVGLERRGDTWMVSVEDAHSPIVRAEWSRDGDRWLPLAPTDGLLDGTTESFEIPAEAGNHLVVVRVVDRQHNRATAGAVETDE